MIKDHEISKIHIAEVVDYELNIRIKDASKKTGAKITIYDNPNFLLNNTDVKNDFSNKKFYLWQAFMQSREKDIIFYWTLMINPPVWNGV